MAKICKKCGVKHKISASKCGNCGASFEDVRVTIIKKTAVIYAVVALLVAIAIIAVIISFMGPRAAVKQIMRHYKGNNPEAIVNSYPDFLLESEGYSKEKAVAEISNYVKQLSGYIVYYKADRPQAPNERDREALLEDFRNYCGESFDESKLEDIKFVWLTFEGEKSGLWGKSITRFTMVKYNDRWCWWPDNYNY